MSRTEELFKEVIENARRDRQKPEKIRDNLIDLKPEQDEIVAIEPLANLGVAENVARLSDVLVKVNSQLVELAKISAKMDAPELDMGEEREDIFDTIEQQEKKSTQVS